MRRKVSIRSILHHAISLMYSIQAAEAMPFLNDYANVWPVDVAFRVRCSHRSNHSPSKFATSPAKSAKHGKQRKRVASPEVESEVFGRSFDSSARADRFFSRKTNSRSSRPQKAKALRTSRLPCRYDVIEFSVLLLQSVGTCRAANLRKTRRRQPSAASLPRLRKPR